MPVLGWLAVHWGLLMSERTFAQVFDLKNAERKTFNLDPCLDSQLYVERFADQGGTYEIERVKQWLSDPHAVALLEGDFGTGKTHFLHHIRLNIAPDINLDPIFVEFSGFKKGSGFERFHELFIEKILNVVMDPLRQWALGEAGYQDCFDGNLFVERDFLKALKNVVPASLLPGDDSEDNRYAKAWLRGSKVLTPSRALKAGYSTMVWEHSPTTLVRLYRSLGMIYQVYWKKKGDARKLLILVDETESFAHVTNSDAQISLGNGLRGLFDEENKQLGFVLGLNVPSHAASRTHPAQRADIRTRLQGRTINLVPFHNDNDMRDFMDKVWCGLTKDSSKRTFLLSDTARDLVLARLESLRVVVGVNTRAATTPRDLLKVLTYIGEHAVKNNIKSMIQSEDINRWFGLGVIDAINATRSHS